MAEEIDDNGFYREDFSAESDWEVFNAQLCTLFQKWELSATDWGDGFEISKCQWLKQEEQLEVMGKSMTILYYKAELKQTVEGSGDESEQPPFHADLMCVSNTVGTTLSLDDGTNQSHYLAHMYSLRRFVVMHPTQLQNKYLTKTSKFNFFLSSISVVAAEVCSAVPIFVQIYDPKWNFYLGVGMTACTRTNFDLVALEQAPKEYLYLSGLVKMFKEKLPHNYDQPAVVSIRNSYNLDTIKLRIPMYVPFGMTPVVDEERSTIAVSQFTALPHGYFPGSNTGMYAEFSWPELTDNMFIDSYMQTQFVPSKAPCGVLFQVVHANSYLTACLKDYFNLIPATNSLESYVGKNFSGSVSVGESNPLDQLSHSHLRKLRSHRQSKQYLESNQTTPQKKIPGPMNEYEVSPMLYYLFPDIHPDGALFPYDAVTDNKTDPHRIKSAEPDSLVQRLSCLLATCHAHFGGKSGLAQFYAAFTRELRLLWDCCIPIPGVAPGSPDLRTCLLHQKLQLLNVCIYRRMKREKGVKADNEDVHEESSYLTEDDTDEEEFYDLTDDDGSKGEQSEDSNKPSVSIKPEGRLRRLGNLSLLHSDDPLYVPVTQEIVPKTEDQLQDDADNVLKMGSDSEFVTDMMCSTVVSDTEAFKAANPNASFEDFIRWFSPNDWEEYMDEDMGIKRYRLSARMQAAGNTWQTVWERAKPVPVSRQKRLFDDTQEGYKILNYLESRNLGEIFALTVVPLLQSAILKLKDILCNADVLDLFNESINEAMADLSRFSRDIELVKVETLNETESSKYVIELTNPRPILKKIDQIEIQFYQYSCFAQMKGIEDMGDKEIHKKFQEILRNNGSCSITRNNGNAAEFSLHSLFQDDMPNKLINKDYVIRMGEGITATRPSLSDRGEGERPQSPLMPQFLRAIVTRDKLRLCGAFTEHTTFLD